MIIIINNKAELNILNFLKFVTMLSRISTQIFRKSVNLYAFSGFREEKDTFGPMKVPADRLWAAQTQRSMQNFDIAKDTDKMPIPLMRAFGILKKCAAKVNIRYGLDQKICSYQLI
jgi:fumarate hydratase class II